MKLRRRGKGATLGLVAVLTLTLILIGSCFFFLARILGGGRQCLNATDAGALAAARAMLAIGLAPGSVGPEFQGFAVNVHTGEPDPAGLMNLFAYNRSAGAACLIAMNALEDGNGLGISNAHIVVDRLQAFGDALNTQILTSGQLGNQVSLDFERVASENNVNMMGTQSRTNLVDNLDFRSVATGVVGNGKANVYFNSTQLTFDPVLAGMAQTAQDKSGNVKSVAVVPGEVNAVFYEKTSQGFQEDQYLLRGYEPIVFDARIPAIYMAAVNPTSKPHLIDYGRYNAGPAQFGYAPVNSVRGQTATKETYKTNNAVSAVACAVVGALYNEYPVILNHAYVRLHNGPDARVANPGLGVIDGNVDGTNNIFNNALFGQPPGGGGIYVTNNDAFFTRFSQGGLAEANAYIHYTTSSTSGWTVDPNGHRPSLDPAVGLEFPPFIRQKYAAEYAYNPYRFNPYWPANKYGSIRIGSGYDQKATHADLLNIHGYAAYCESLMYGQPNLPSKCATGVGQWQSNYNNGPSTGTPMPYGPPGLTDLEALKGEVETQWIEATKSGNFSNYSFSSDGSELANPSGSKLYSRTSLGYANPTNATNIAFGTPGTPYALLVQLTQNGSGVCMNPDDPLQWNNSSTMLGKLLGRCKQIVPSADWLTVRGLLNVYPINLGDYQYIYSPDGISLTVSTTPPAFLGNLPERTQPGITKPDGTLTGNCQDTTFQGSLYNQVDAEIGYFGNFKGDNGLHKMPFQSATGYVDTYDFTNWQGSSGKDDLLGQLSFYNQVSANVQFSSPN